MGWTRRIARDRPVIVIPMPRRGPCRAASTKSYLVGNLGKRPRGAAHAVRRRHRQPSARHDGESWRDKASAASARRRPSGTRSSIFNENIAKVAEQYLKKGSKVYIEGQLQTRKYNDKDGVEKYTHRSGAAALPRRIDDAGRPQRQPAVAASPATKIAAPSVAVAAVAGERPAFGRSSPMESRGGASGGGGGRGGSMSDAIDDDIPF